MSGFDEVVLPSLASSYRSLKKVKPNTAFAVIKPKSPQHPPWVIVGKPSEVRKASQAASIQAAGGDYLKNQVIQGRVEEREEGITFVVFAEADQGPLSTWLARGGATLRTAAAGAPASFKEGGSLSKLAGLLGSIQVVFDAEAPAGAPDAPPTASSATAPDTDTERDAPEDALEAAAEAMQLRILAREAAARAQLRQDSEDLLRAVAEGGETREIFLRIAQQRTRSADPLQVGAALLPEDRLLSVQSLIAEYLAIRRRFLGALSAPGSAAALLRAGNEKLEALRELLEG